MARSKIFIVMVALLAAGCGLNEPNRPPPHLLSDAQISQLRGEIQAIGDRCRSLRVSGRVRGFVGSVQCSNPGILAAYEKVDYPYMSLVNLALAERLQLAERVDEKKITEGDMLVEFFTDVRSLPAMCSP
jgi:hypothetical protein